MPWYAVPYDSPARKRLTSALKVKGIPTLIILGPDGSVVAPNAQQAAAADPKGENFPWQGAKGGGSGSSSQLNQFLMTLLFALIMWLVRYFTEK